MNPRFWYGYSLQIQVRMIRCVGAEPTPPDDSAEFELWCESGNSGRPIQTHLGDRGSVLWVTNEGNYCVQFEDGDERVLFPRELTFLNPVLN